VADSKSVSQVVESPVTQAQMTAVLEAVADLQANNPLGISRSTKTEMESSASAINQANKYIDKPVVDIASGVLFLSQGVLPEAKWRSVNGTTEYTPTL